MFLKYLLVRLCNFVFNRWVTSRGKTRNNEFEFITILFYKPNETKSRFLRCHPFMDAVHDKLVYIYSYIIICVVKLLKLITYRYYQIFFKKDGYIV